MRRLGRRPWTGLRLRIAPRKFFRPQRRKLRTRTVALLLLLAAAVAGFCAFLEQRVSPHVQNLAQVAAKQQAAVVVSAAVEQVLTEERLTYEQLVHYTADSSGIRSIQTNSLRVNLLRGKINTAVEQAVTLRRGRLKLPMGALLGSNLFAGAGPNITVPLRMTGHALSDVRSDLSSAGVNQSMHRILMDLHVSLSVILSGGAVESEVDITVCLAETVIVGEVPAGMITQK